MTRAAMDLAASDDLLVQRCRSGDEAAFDALVKRYQEKVYGLGLRLLGNVQEAEEVLQDTFLQVYRKLGDFRGDSAFATWLYRVATNVALMRRRTRARQESESLEDYLPRFNESGRMERLDLDYGRAARADEILERKDLARRALEAVVRLPEKYRDTFVLHDLEDLSTEETAQVLSLEPGVVRTRLHRARLMMRGFLGHLAGGEA